MGARPPSNLRGLRRGLSRDGEMQLARFIGRGAGGGIGGGAPFPVERALAHELGLRHPAKRGAVGPEDRSSRRARPACRPCRRHFARCLPPNRRWRQAPLRASPREAESRLARAAPAPVPRHQAPRPRRYTRAAPPPSPPRVRRAWASRSRRQTWAARANRRAEPSRGRSQRRGSTSTEPNMTSWHAGVRRACCRSLPPSLLWRWRRSAHRCRRRD